MSPNGAVAGPWGQRGSIRIRVRQRGYAAVMGSSESVPARMHAAYVERPGPVESIVYGELPVPAPGRGEVLVRVEATAVNHVDTFVRSGSFSTPVPRPLVLGRDLVGRVVACGAQVEDVTLGERIWSNSLGHAGRQGAAADYAVVPARRRYRLPAGADPTEAVTVFHPGATAYLALHEHGQVHAGQTVYVGGAAGHVGRAATTLAVRAGARVVASAGETDLEDCRQQGADAVIDYRDPAFADRLHAAAPDGIDVFLDTSGHNDLRLATEVLAFGGRVVLIAGLDSHPRLPVGAVYTNDASILGFAISNASVAQLAAAAEQINALIADRTLVPREVAALPLDQAAEAHRRLERGEARGIRLVLTP